MNRREILVAQAAEECSELAKELIKCLRFGFNDRMYPEGPTNGERVTLEFNDLMAVLEMALGRPAVDFINPNLILMKKDKVEKYLELSKDLGFLKE